MKDDIREALSDFVNNPNKIEPSINYNGYISIPFIKSYELHIWFSALNIPNHFMRIHNHNWMTRSTVIHGALHNTIYKRVNLYEDSKSKAYELYDSDTLFSYDYVVDLIIDKERSTILTPGQSVTIMMGTYHSMWSIEPMSINIVSLLGTKPGDFEPKIAVPYDNIPHREDNMKGLHPSAIPSIVQQACNILKQYNIGDKEKCKIHLKK